MIQLAIGWGVFGIPCSIFWILVYPKELKDTVTFKEGKLPGVLVICYYILTFLSIAIIIEKIK